MFQKWTMVPCLSGSGFEASVASLCSQNSLQDIMRGLAVGSDFNVLWGTVRDLARAKFEQIFDSGL